MFYMQNYIYPSFPYWLLVRCSAKRLFKILTRVFDLSGFLSWTLCRLRVVQHLSLPSSLRTCLIVSDTRWLLSMVFLLLSSLYLYSPWFSCRESSCYFHLTAFARILMLYTDQTRDVVNCQLTCLCIDAYFLFQLLIRFYFYSSCDLRLGSLVILFVVLTFDFTVIFLLSSAFCLWSWLIAYSWPS